MLRLIIVDDEKIIRETIHNFIDWNSIGIEVVGVCKDGIEAYNTILDEFPDIVLTDIKMPGLSGLELIERIINTDSSIEFVILSGYGDFEYAKQAMKHGVKHYLLKPCNESQIIEVIQAVKEDCYKKRAHKEERIRLSRNLEKNMFKNLLFECLAQQGQPEGIIREYELFLDFRNINYELCYFHYLEEEYLGDFLNELTSYMEVEHPNTALHILYVKNTLLIFFQSFEVSYEEMDAYFCSACNRSRTSGILYHREAFPNLSQLLYHLLGKLSRYEKILLIEEENYITICNHNALFQNMNQLLEHYSSETEPDYVQLLADISALLHSIDDIPLIKAFSANLILKLSSAFNLTQTLDEMNSFISEQNDCRNIDEIRSHVMEELQNSLLTHARSSKKYKDFIEKTIRYVDENLSNPNLSLKWIAENYMFMNADYLSKQFFKQTGCKFSYYLTNARIEKAKALLMEYGQEKIYIIAEQVGCGNNPQYFSQIFRKHTGLTPTAYIKKIMEEI